MDATLRKLAQDALDVQDACNLSGVVHGFSRAMTALRDTKPMSTTELNTHPVAILWADKIAQLTNTQTIGGAGYSRITAAYKWAHEQVKGAD
jgi:hypothetical protein